MTDDGTTDPLVNLIAARQAKFDPANLDPKIRSWLLEVGGHVYWVGRQVGADLRWFYGVNPGDHPYLADFLDHHTGDLTTVHLAPDSAWTLTASDDAPEDE